MNDPIQHRSPRLLPLRTPGPLHLLALFILLQLAVTLLTNGFTLYFDEAIWHYIGRNWFRHGLVPYGGGVDNKSPLIFAIFGLSDKLFGVNYWFPRIVGTACQTVGLWYVYKIAEREAGKQAGMLALQLYGLALLWHATNGKYVSLTETYEVTGIILSVFLFLTAKKSSGFFLSGLAAAAGCGFRLTALSGIAAIGWYSLSRRLATAEYPPDGRQTQKFSRRRRWAAATLFFLGLLAGLLLLAAMASLAGIHLSDFFLYGIRDNFGANSPTDHPFSWRLEQLSEKFFYSEMVLLYPGAITYILWKKKPDLFIGWAACVFFAICLLGMPDPAHLKDILPPLCLTSAIALHHLIQRYGLPLRPILWVLWLVFVPKLSEPLIAAKALLSASNEHPEKCCLAPWPEPDNYARKRLGWWIRSATTPQEKVLVAGDGAQVQVYSERLSPSIYFNATGTRIARIRFRNDLLADEPALIAVPLFDAYRQNNDAGTRHLIDSLVTKDYYSEGCRYGYAIYRQLSGRSQRLDKEPVGVPRNITGNRQATSGNP